MNTPELPRQEKPGWRPTRQFSGLLSAKPSTETAYPEDLEEATDYILGKGLPEVADYAGYPDVQRSVALEIADQIFIAGADLNQALQGWSASQLPRFVRTLDLTEENCYNTGKLPETVASRT